MLSSRCCLLFAGRVVFYVLVLSLLVVCVCVVVLLPAPPCCVQILHRIEGQIPRSEAMTECVNVVCPAMWKALRSMDTLAAQGLFVVHFCSSLFQSFISFTCDRTSSPVLIICTCYHRRLVIFVVLCALCFVILHIACGCSYVFVIPVQLHISL